MPVLGQVRNFIRAFRNHRPESRQRHHGHAIARTFKHGTTVAGGKGHAGMGLGNNTRRENLMSEAADRYDESFDDS